MRIYLLTLILATTNCAHASDYLAEALSKADASNSARHEITRKNYELSRQRIEEAHREYIATVDQLNILVDAANQIMAMRGGVQIPFPLMLQAPIDVLPTESESQPEAEGSRESLGYDTFLPTDLFALAEELRAQESMKKSRGIFRILIKYYPNHKLAHDAARRMVEANHQ